MKIKKIYQGTVPENKILNTHTDSQTDVYSCDYINDNIHTYEDASLLEDVLQDSLIITNGENGFSRNGNQFIAESSSGVTYETTIKVSQKNLVNLYFYASLYSSSNDSTVTETDCVPSIIQTYTNEESESTELVMWDESRTTFGWDNFYVPLNDGDSITIRLECPEGHPIPTGFAFELDMYEIAETTTDAARIAENKIYYNNYLWKQDFEILWDNFDYLWDAYYGLTEPQIPFKDGAEAEDSTFDITLEDNQEYRLLLMDTNKNEATININLDCEFKTDERFQCLFTLFTHHRSDSTCTINFQNCSPKFSGDDVEDGVFTPQYLKAYEMLFYWDGFVYLHCLVKSTDLVAPEE